MLLMQRLFCFISLCVVCNNKSDSVVEVSRISFQLAVAHLIWQFLSHTFCEEFYLFLKNTVKCADFAFLGETVYSTWRLGLM